ncbi:co-chaperone DjlA [Thiohalobacter thiocyanaticus]|uniref:Co-chaperone protein DjlA n=1 Tax=Thiohalobacter thiocyanaticus TaxID=585455 RepID=A0A426QKI8_9GAMM|nr:co-chaperone DjlA [Thiohalobacter thiocyanaticus]RRQ22268.1 co-chaperone DjlA [Thiohalobacter thiocyanaticus]
MSWWGKLVGGAFGFMLGGPLGALLGGALGHQFDKGLHGMAQLGYDGPGPGDQARVQTAFFTASFAVMGHIAKADGQVSSNEISLAEAVMDRMRLSPEMRRTAIRLFNEGKAPDFDLEAVLEQFRRESHRRRHLLQMFLEIQLHAAYADGSIDPAETRILDRIRQRLGFSRHEFEHLENLVKAARFFTGEGARAGAGVPPSHNRLAEAYKVLDVARTATDAEVKKAYRRLMNQHHPDKLVSKGLPEEMIEMATEKSQEIRAAYDTVMESRGKK